jgi:two-component system phosphate regulon sensor histidine kinase PhoR
MSKNIIIFRVISIILLLGAIAGLISENWLIALLLAALSGMMIFHLRERARLIGPISEYVDAARDIEHGVFRKQMLLRNVPVEWRPLSDAFHDLETELSKREAGLLTSSASLEAVLASISEGVLAMDAEGELMVANQAACQMLVMDKQTMVGRKLAETIRIPELNAAIARANKKKSRTECEFQTFAEPRRIVRATLTPLQSREVAIAIVMHDVTGIRQLETMRRDFVANVSHELKTPLSVIKAYAETLKMGAINDQVRNIEFVEEIESQAALLERQIQDLLQLARIESGQANLEITDLNVNALCNECYQQLQAIAAKRKIDFQLHLTDEPLNVTGDAEALRAILKNLISNAIQYTPQGKVTVQSDRKEDTVIIEVSDTGIGISPSQQSRIFERFYRADKARSRDMGGTGLGLAIVKHLTTSLGGDVSVESKIGKGSTFRVELPLASKSRRTENELPSG